MYNTQINKIMIVVFIINDIHLNMHDVKLITVQDMKVGQVPGNLFKMTTTPYQMSKNRLKKQLHLVHKINNSLSYSNI